MNYTIAIALFLLVSCNRSNETEIKRKGGIQPIACSRILEAEFNLDSCRDGRGTVWVCFSDNRAVCEPAQKLILMWNIQPQAEEIQ